MDREIPASELRRKRIRQIAIAVAAAAIATAALMTTMRMMRASVSSGDLRFGLADTGDIETSVNASGRLTPAFEQTINSPISTRVLEVYRTSGDSVMAGDPLLRLDLTSTETRLRQLDNERSIRMAAKEKTWVASENTISDLEMQIRVSEMTLEKLREDLRNEQRLDSIGSGTGERIRQARLACETAALQLDQLHQKLDNQKLLQRAELRTSDLDISISSGDISEIERTLADAQVKAPRNATITYIANEIGRQVNAGEKLAVIADLTHFKVEGEIPDAHAGKFTTGSPAMALAGGNRFEGVVTNIEPQSQGGVTKFTISLKDSGNPQLRAGLSTQVYIFTDIHKDVVRIPTGPYYNGPGDYTLFVRGDGKLLRRSVTLGESNYDWVEVRRGISPGETVNLTDLAKFKDYETININ